MCARGQVTLLGVSKMLDKCAKGRKMQGALHPRVTYACLEERHFEPFVVTTQPYEQAQPRHACLAQGEPARVPGPAGARPSLIFLS